MSLIKWKAANDPFKDFFESDFPFSGGGLVPFLDYGSFQKSRLVPAIDITGDEKSVKIKADLPGMDRKDIDVKVDGTVLTISAERKNEEQKNEKGYTRYERSYGLFQRSLDLGTSVDADKITASYKDGVLELNVPKTQTTQTKQIKIDG